jgi:hypothetical protein
VGTRDNTDLLYLFTAVNRLSRAPHSNTLEDPADVKKKTGKSKNHRMQVGFADQLGHGGRVYPPDKHREVVLLIDNARWHDGNLEAVS